MSTVKILVDYVGPYMAGDIITDAPEHLVQMATLGVVNAATGMKLAEIVVDPIAPLALGESESIEAIAILSELTGKAIEYGIPDAESLSITELISAIVHTEWVNRDKAAAQDAFMQKEKADKEASDAELSGLKEKAKELKIAGYTKMNIEELYIAINATVVGGGEDGK